MRARDRQLLFLFWILPAFVGAYGLHLVSVKYNPDLTFVEKLGSQVLVWCAWGIWAQLIFFVCDKVPFTQATWPRAIVVLIPLCAAVVVAQIFVVEGVSVAYGLSPGWPLTSVIPLGMREFGDMHVTVFWGIVGAHAAFRWHDRWLAERMRATQLAHDLADAQLRALKAQVNPHFLFNALNSVVSLLRRDPPAAERVVIDLGDLLRSTLTLSSAQEIPLADELAIVRRYLDIEQVRFSDRLTVCWQVDDAANRCLVPALVMQPLVENAIVHGTSRTRGPSTITIGAARRDGRLTLTVRDNGPGVSDDPTTQGTGIGTTNVRERLASLYGDSASLTLGANPGGGCVSKVSLPARESSGA